MPDGNDPDDYIKKNGKENFLSLLKQDKDVTLHLTETDLESLFNPERFLKHLDHLWGRIFNG